MDNFIKIINVLQEKEYSLDDHEKGKIRKQFAYHMIPRLILEGYDDHLNKQWLADNKEEKEDDFIDFTHLNPALQQF